MDPTYEQVVRELEKWQEKTEEWNTVAKSLEDELRILSSWSFVYIDWDAKGDTLFHTHSARELLENLKKECKS